MRPEALTKKEQGTVVDVILGVWASGDWDFFFENEEDAVCPPGFTHDSFHNKWRLYINQQAERVEELVGKTVFGDSWE